MNWYVSVDTVLSGEVISRSSADPQKLMGPGVTILVHEQFKGHVENSPIWAENLTQTGDSFNGFLAEQGSLAVGTLAVFYLKKDKYAGYVLVGYLTTKGMQGWPPSPVIVESL